jgi:hypothetical protein
VNVALEAPAATVTVAGTVALEWASESNTVAPPAGAGPVSVTVPVVFLQPHTGFGAMVTVDKVGGATVTVTDLVAALYAPEMVIELFAVTTLVAIVKLALVAPAGTVTDTGTVATAVLLLASVTTIPPTGATPVNATFPVAFLPPVTVNGFAVMLLKATGTTVSKAVFVTPAVEAVIVAVA